MNTEPTTSPRRPLVVLLIVVIVGTTVGRIFSTQRVYEPSLTRPLEMPKDPRSAWPKDRPNPMPTFSSNDRSRWATVRSLVDEGTWVIGRRDPKVTLQTAALLLSAQDPVTVSVLAQRGFQVRVKSDSGIVFDDGYQTVDKVLHPTKQEYYSTKPPLLTALVAGLYWLLKTLLGWTLVGEPFAVVRTILILVNVLPFIAYLLVLNRLLERLSISEWTRWFLLALAGFGTLVTPFLVTLNNHTWGTFSVLFALASALAVLPGNASIPGSSDKPGSWLHFVSAGFFSGFAVCNELPALAFAAALGVVLLYWRPAQTLLLFTPALLLPVAAFFVANYAAVGQLRPAYSEFGGPWYEYEGSHWRQPPPGKEKDKRGIDWAKYHETRLEYGFHLVVGHHGFFSLTPAWLLALGVLGTGTWYGWRNYRLVRAHSPPNAGPNLHGLPWWLPAFTLGVSVVVLGFYWLKSDNYAGWSNGLRWLMWLTPLWLLCLAPAVERLHATRWGRGLAYTALGFSILTAFYQSWNPWRHPWIYDALMSLGWSGY